MVPKVRSRDARGPYNTFQESTRSKYFYNEDVICFFLPPYSLVYKKEFSRVHMPSDILRNSETAI